MGTTAVFLDAGYIDKVLKADFGEPRIDLHKLSISMAGADELLRAYYYNCLPFQSAHPTQAEKDRYSKAHRFITALKALPRFEVRLGKLAYRGNDSNGNPIFIQRYYLFPLGM